jgi:hypothetical protein
MPASWPAPLLLEALEEADELLANDEESDACDDADEDAADALLPEVMTADELVVTDELAVEDDPPDDETVPLLLPTLPVEEAMERLDDTAPEEELDWTLPDDVPDEEDAPDTEPSVSPSTASLQKPSWQVKPEMQSVSAVQANSASAGGGRHMGHPALNTSAGSKNLVTPFMRSPIRQRSRSREGPWLGFILRL